MRWLFLVILLACWKISAALSISIQGADQHLQNSITRLTIADITKLLHQACSCSVELNNQNSSVRLILPNINPEFASSLTEFEKEPYPVLHYPEQDYSWSSKDSSGIIILKLDAKTFNGISFGLYGLLQEKLGYQFYHPREMVVPSFNEWPLAKSFQWTATPRFHKMGFHLHTQHPIELTEDLMNPSTESARNRIKEYIDWLARNQQNYFEYNLLESIDLKNWAEQIAPVVEYGHQRGIIMGIDVSLHMIQQKAFMLYNTPPNSFRSKKKQIDRNLEHLCKAKWDVFDVEFSSTEFTKGNEKKKKKLQLHLTDRLTNKYGIKPMGRMHVVKKSEMIGGDEAVGLQLAPKDSMLDSHRGILIHTVMFYSLIDEKAPVYQNDNLKHMLDALLEEQKQRETWYYPESAYWITFDNSVPMFLMPYLSARLDDILLCDSLNVTGHVTFSSGWEWGYWLFDWSIARWSWKYSESGIWQQPEPAQFLSTLFSSPGANLFFRDALKLQQHFLKDDGLIQYMTAMTVTDEMPGPLNLQLHPRPENGYRWIRKESDQAYLENLQKDISGLLSFAQKTDSVVFAMNTWWFPEAENWTASQRKIFDELLDGIRITSLRAWYRASILSAMAALRLQELNNVKPDASALLDEAEKIRMNAQDIVKRREQQYRYPLELLTGKYFSHTSYNHGYLFSVHDLHFWKREQEQIRKDKWGPMFMSIWDIPRIIGLRN